MTLRDHHGRPSSINRFGWLAIVVGCALSNAAYADAPHPAVARIVVQEAGGVAYGSGTLVDVRDQYGLVATNWHVVRDATGKIEVVFPDGFRSEARALKLDEDWDLAALVIWRPLAAPAPLAQTAPRPGEPLTICGYGQGQYRAATGRCTEYYAPKIGLPHELVELDVEARQGDSGGPIFNQQGELAGVLFGAGQGTTMGAFGGRVNAFLSTLASDIGQRAPPRGLDPVEPKPPTLTNEPPTLVAVAPAPVTQPRSSVPAKPDVESTTTTITDASTEGWASSTSSTAQEAFAPWSANTTATDTPAFTANTPQPALPVDSHTWFDDLKSLFALIGVFAVLLAVVKTIT